MPLQEEFVTMLGLGGLALVFAVGMCVGYWLRRTR